MTLLAFSMGKQVFRLVLKIENRFNDVATISWLKFHFIDYRKIPLNNLITLATINIFFLSDFK